MKEYGLIPPPTMCSILMAGLRNETGGDVRRNVVRDARGLAEALFTDCSNETYHEASFRIKPFPISSRDLQSTSRLFLDFRKLIQMSLKSFHEGRHSIFKH